MAHSIVTQVRLTATADALCATGEEPSSLTVQARIGGGSDTTITWYLDVWKQQQAQIPTIAVPALLVERSAALVRDLWHTASALTDHE